MLRGYLTILEKKQPDPTLNKYFSKVSIAAQRIASMIQFTKEYEKIGVNAPVWQDCRTLIDTAANEAPLGKVVVCEDDGNGVVDEEKERIFERGFGKNTGMGLFLFREILTIIGITIRENGELSKGTRFEMAVPKGVWK